MKKVLLATAAAACFGTGALAGPNQGGTLIIVTDGVVYCEDNGPFCGSSTATRCEDGVAQADGAAPAIVLNVLAAFDPGASPRVAGITFGIAYDSANTFLVGFGSCGDFELPDATWPASGTGTAVTWNVAQTAPLNDVYWIAAYNYYGGPNTLDLIPHPTQGANFVDDSIQSEIDPIAGLGSFGFDGPGHLPCPDAGAPGACCAADGSCTVVLEADCLGYFEGSPACDPNPCGGPVGACCVDGVCSIRMEAECAGAGGDYVGDGTLCDPEQCVIPVVESTWGEIKSTFR